MVSYNDLVWSGTVRPNKNYKYADKNFKDYTNRVARHLGLNGGDLVEVIPQILANDGASFEQVLTFKKPFAFKKSNGEIVVYTDLAHCQLVRATVWVAFDKNAEDMVKVGWGEKIALGR